MQRKAYGPGRAPGRPRVVGLSGVVLALGLGVGLTGCSAGSAEHTATVDAKAGPVTTTAAPGRYRTLFEPCGAVPQATLKDLLPGAAGLPDGERERAYRGTAAVTFDTDRRVGCAWKADAPDATHRLTLDIERVVSYDPGVSDDDRAQEVFGRKQTAAGIVTPPPATTPPPTTPPPATPTATATATTPPTGTGTGTDTAATTAARGASAGSPLTGHLPLGPVAPQAAHRAAGVVGTPPASGAASGAPSGAPGAPSGTPSGTGLEPRILEGLGDAAFVDDALVATGPAGAKRLVSVVFRTSNVIVTVAYEEQTTTSTEPPDSRELQEKARNLARLLAERLEE
ncbi:DUF3558 domain-containing protein [Streptomyces sp. NPDC090025]|uniref:DUF3558 domain-containing protein n=1 Tax=Streptomyces sp. NPDC090025 TaxID=3365922 RepID=UPI003835F3B1